MNHLQYLDVTPQNVFYYFVAFLLKYVRYFGPRVVVIPDLFQKTFPVYLFVMWEIFSYILYTIL